MLQQKVIVKAWLTTPWLEALDPFATSSAATEQLVCIDEAGLVLRQEEEPRSTGVVTSEDSLYSIDFDLLREEGLLHIKNTKSGHVGKELNWPGVTGLRIMKGALQKYQLLSDGSVLNQLINKCQHL